MTVAKHTIGNTFCTRCALWVPPDHSCSTARHRIATKPRAPRGQERIEE